MIYLVTAPPGGGKSYYAIRKAVTALSEGKFVAGNVRLADDFAERIVRRNPVYWVRRVARRRFLQEARERYHFSEDLDELGSIRLEGEREGRGLMILDEAHNWMNARSWTAEDRKAIVRLFSQHRKLGWDILLIAQHPEMIDKQVRNLVEYNVFLRNLKKARWGGVPVFPVNLFFAVWCWHSAQRLVVKRELFRLTWVKDLYDTHATSHGLKSRGEEDSVIWLPSSPIDRGQHVPPPDARTAPEASSGRPPEDALPPAVTSQDASAEAGEAEGWEVLPELDAPDVSASADSHKGGRK